MGQHYLDSEEVRNLLQNAGKIKKDGKCIHCGGTGWLNWNGETGQDVKFGKISDTTERECDECEHCEGVGYVW